MNFTILETGYDYAGFLYTIIQNDGDPFVCAVPEDGQHSAAKKDKHRQAAAECWKSDQRSTRKK